MDKEKRNRSFYINKIASALNMPDLKSDNSKHIGGFNNKNALKLSSISLKIASEKMRDMEKEIGMLRSENKKLLSEKNEKEKKEKVSLLVKKMFEKGLINKSDISEEENKLFNMSETAFNEISSFVESIRGQPKDENYVSSLDYLIDNKKEDGDSMADALANFIK